MPRAYRWSMDEQLRAELLHRVEKDQAARKALDPDAMKEADGENLPWLKAVVAEHGWPGASLVGADGAHAAWLLAQHADAEPAFQRQCLDLMTAAVEANEATVRELAYLTDRVLLAEGQPQEYGTQVTRRGDAWVPRDLRDPDDVDARRAAADLEPLADYLRLFHDHPRQPARLKCPGCGAWAPFEEPEGDKPVTVTCPECGREMTVTLKRASG
jgi:hypothetical protein